MDEEGKVLAKDQALWEEIMKDSRYIMFMDKLDRWTKLLGTVLVKVAFVDPNTGHLVKKTEGGVLQLDMLHGGVYDLRYGASPYYITELMIGFDNSFQGFSGAAPLTGGSILQRAPATASPTMGLTHVANTKELSKVNKIYWSANEHTILDNENKAYATKNPYGVIPAVPFFNADPAHYYFLPINEPLIYANHAINMRMTDLNHIAKFQSFGIPVMSGVERPTNVRQGRPADDFNMLRGGSSASRFGGMGGAGATGSFRTFDAGMNMFRDGNADSNALGFSIGPDTAIAVGEKGDFRFEHPKADINGLIKTIQSMTDMVRVSHGLRPKHQDSLAASGFAMMMDKMGVLEENIRRGKLFKEREQQLFQVIKKLYNTHNGATGDKRFSENAQLQVTYVPPEFPVDPMTKLQSIITEQSIWNTGDVYSIQKIHPHISEAEIRKTIKQRRKDMEEQAHHDTEKEIDLSKKKIDAGVESDPTETKGELKPDLKKVDNKVKHAEESSKQPKKGDNVRKKRQKAEEKKSND